MKILSSLVLGGQRKQGKCGHHSEANFRLSCHFSECSCGHYPATKLLTRYLPTPKKNMQNNIFGRSPPACLVWLGEHCVVSREKTALSLSAKNWYWAFLILHCSLISPGLCQQLRVKSLTKPGSLGAGKVCSRDNRAPVCLIERLSPWHNNAATPQRLGQT